jgi:hypothetical protein
VNARVNISEDDSAPYEDMNVSLLAAQPLQPRKEKTVEWNATYQFLSARLQSLRSWRWMKWTYWEVLARYFVPFRYSWVVTANKMTRGHPVNDSIIDSTGLLAVRTCSAGMWTGLTSPSRPWFKFGVGAPGVKLDRQSLQWIENLQEAAYTVLKQSNFYSQMATAFKDLVWAGTSPIIIYEDFEDVVRFYVPCAGEYFVDEGARLSADTLYREFTLNVLQIVDMFGIDNCPEQVTKLWMEGGGAYQTEFVIAHAIEPNTPIPNKSRNGDPGARPVPEKFAYREIYWLRDQKTPRPLSVRGFNAKPFAVFRWSLVSNDPYGHGPCEDALGDNKQIQLETRRKAEFIGKGVRPPMGADPALKNEPTSIIEGNITYFSTDGNKKGFFPLFEPNPAWLPGITADIEKVSERIKEALFVKLFMAISQMEGVQPRNELELTKRDLERLQELGPVIDLAEKEIDSILIRVVNIIQRRKMIPPKPAALDRVPLKIVYVSILRLAQRAAESVAMKDVLQVGGVMSSAAKAAGIPDPLRTLNLDKAYRHYADLNGFPGTLFFTDDEVQQHDQIREQEARAAQAPQQMQPMVDAAKTLADTQLGGNTALNGLMGGSGAPG